MVNLPRFCVIVGANGTGKSTLFEVFDFLQDALMGNVNTALFNLSGGRGFQEVRSRSSTGPIELTLRFREKPGKPLKTYFLQINETDGKAYVEREILRYRKGDHGRPEHILDFSNGSGTVVSNDTGSADGGSVGETLKTKLKSPDILAIRGFSQFKMFPTIVALGNLIENRHVSGSHFKRTHPEEHGEDADFLSGERKNLTLAIQYLHQHHPKNLETIFRQLGRLIPGTRVETKSSEEGPVLLKIQEGIVKDSCSAQHASDATLKMLSFLIVLYTPQPYPLLCVAEPENHFYPQSRRRLAEELRNYSKRSGQIIVTTHSPDILNAATADDVFWLEKNDGYTTIVRACEDQKIVNYTTEGAQMGDLWKQGFFGGIDPN